VLALISQLFLQALVLLEDLQAKKAADLLQAARNAELKELVKP
jgi:hypothetical protein